MTGAVSSVVMPSYVVQMRKILDCDIQVLMSKGALNFVTEYTMKLHSGNQVFTNSFQSIDDVLVPHIKLTNEADLLLVMPATANIISKVANGICDDIISTSILAAKVPVIFVPSMNANMWNSSILKQNIKVLLNHSYYFINPIEGLEIQGLAETTGVMPRLNEIIKSIVEIISSSNIKS